jgi:hypothetical protein
MGSVIGGCVIFLAINQSPVLVRRLMRAARVWSRRSFRRGAFSVAPAHSPSSALPGVGGEALLGRFLPDLAASVRSDAAFFREAKARPTGSLTGRAG